MEANESGVMRTSDRIKATLVLVLLIVSIASPASAHSGDESYLYLDIYDSSVDGRVEFPIDDLNDVLGLDLPLDEDGAIAAAEDNRRLIHSYAADHVALEDADGAWPIRFGDFSVLEIGASGSYLIVDFEVTRDFVSVPRQFTATYDGIVHAKPERSALLIIGTDWGSGTFNNEADFLLRYTADQTTQTVDLGDTSFWKGFAGVIDLGVEHIRIGTDHILFIVALVLPSVLVFRREPGWLPSPSFGASLWRVLKIVTMFTIAHTITLTLGGLGIIELPAPLVETVIAISIILAAIHNIRPVLVNKEWLIAFGFGLVHGFGFAGLLSDLGLTQSRRVVSLLGFNLGIELGQAVIILLVFPALFLARRTRAYVPAMNVASLVLILIASVWAIERAFSVDLGTEWVMDRASVWPRQLILVAVIYALALFAYRRDRSNGDLLPLERDAESEPVEAVTGR